MRGIDVHPHTLVLVDRARLDLFDFLRGPRAQLQAARPFTDGDGVGWLAARHRAVYIGLTWLGPGWVFDSQAVAERRPEYDRLAEAMRAAGAARHARELRRAAGGVCLGGHAARVLWAVHAAVLAHRTSLLQLADVALAAAVWGADRRRRPRHWRGVLRRVLRGLCWLHAAEAAGPDPPAFGAATALLHHAGDLRGDGGDACAGHCPAGLGRHHHFQVDVGRGLLGSLEAFATADPSDGRRAYEFPAGGPPGRPTLRALGKEGRLVSVFLPAVLGEPRACRQFTPRQHALLQALVRETTRTPRGRKRHGRLPDASGGRIPDFRGRSSVPGPGLDPKAAYAAFAGNGVRRGLGYLLDSAGGWLAKAGYPPGDVPAFLADLDALAGPLGLAVAGVGPGPQPYCLAELRGLAATAAGRAVLGRLHVRAYTADDYLARWSALFAADPAAGIGPPLQPGADATALLAALAAKGVSQRALAAGVGVDPSFVGKALNGRKPWPAALLARARDWVDRQPGPGEAADAAEGRGDSDVLAEALRCRRRGWSVVPICRGAKRPPVRWKAYQDRLPTEDELRDWFGRWPDAGLALVLGPVSGVLVIDVDGPEAYAALVGRLGREPVAPKALSGSREPDRFHLYFRHPDLPTRAKATPWHPKLEFRGRGGIVVMPPSVHKSGRRYAWAAGRSPDRMPLPELPAPVVTELLPPRRKGQAAAETNWVAPLGGVPASPSTREFLAGKYADGPGWNDRLFRAACDLCARDVPLAAAEPLLLAGARPDDDAEREQAAATIRSAYSAPRVPSRK
jgi:hypothetical protein